MDSRFDDLLHTVIVEKGQGIYGFFDVVMGFMYRRTDFFYEMAPGENMGFFPGQAEAIVYNFFRKYQNVHYKERVPKRNIDPKEIEDYMKTQKEKGGNKIPDTTKTEIKQIESAKNEAKQVDKIESKPVENIINSVETKQETIKTEPKVSPTFTSISTYNGDKCENYNWSQGVIDVSIQIELPVGTNKKDVNNINSAKCKHDCNTYKS
jgi:hypothetical protein